MNRKDGSSPVEAREILESISDAFFALDSQWCFTYVNANAEWLLRRSREELLDRVIWDEFPEAVGSTFYRSYQAAMETGETYFFTEFYPPLDTWFDVRAYPFEGGLSVYFTDATQRVLEERFQVEQTRFLEMVVQGTALHTTLERLIRAVEDRSPGAQGAVVLLDPVSREPHFLVAPTLDVSRLTSSSLFDPTVEAAAQGDEARDPWSHPVRGSDGEILGSFKLFSPKDGPPTSEELFLLDRAGRLTGIAVERDRRLRAIRESEERFRSLVEATTSIVWTTSPDGELKGEQPGWSRFTGQSSEAAAEGGWIEAVHPEDREMTHRAWSAALHAETTYEVEHRIRRHDGEYRYMVARAVPVHDDDGSIREWIGTHTDITERRQAQELARSNRDLEQFAYIASHDLQEPLRKVLAYSELVESEYADRIGPDGREYLERIRGAADRMQILIRDLLAYSRLTTRKQPLGPVDLGVVVAEVLSDLESRIVETGATIEVGELPTVEADGLQMRQLFQNLIGNALKFHRPGRPPVVAIEASEEEGRQRISVRDEGIGFDAQYAERIFEPFQRLHNRTRYAGTGIGLAICRRIAERHGGEITADAQPDQGATFTVILPEGAARP